ncbi:hypothetical protein FOA52_008120 [Chlamydomonas sp. UWO 241]|nr:hypothetical protein FOA52_008120 [Chlamydomonas sp. UWO 241]
MRHRHTTTLRSAAPGGTSGPSAPPSPGYGSSGSDDDVRAAPTAPSKPPVGPDRGSRMMALGMLGTLELMLTGSVLWSPLVALGLILAFSPSKEEEEVQRRMEVEAAVEKVRREMASRVQVTPAESAEWLNAFNAELWAAFVVPAVLKDNLGGWQDKISSAAPRGWSIELVDLSLGDESPKLSNVRVFNNVRWGGMQAIEMDLELTSASMRVVVKGSGPLGQFTGTISGFSVKGPVRLAPVFSQRMVLWSFKEAPEARFKLQISGLPLVGQQDVPQLSFFQSAFTSAIRDFFVEPRRGALSLDYAHTGLKPIDTTVNIYVQSVQGLSSRPAAVAAGGSSSGTARVKEAGTQVDIELLDPVRATDTFLLDSLERNSAAAAASSGAAAAAAPAAMAAALSGGGGTTSAAAAAPPQPPPAATQQRRIIVVAKNLDSKLQRSTRPAVVSGLEPVVVQLQLQEAVKLALGSRQGLIRLEVREVGGSSSTPRLLGFAVLHVAASKEGSTLFWAVGRNNAPVALRWQQGLGPWRVTLPLEGCPSMPRASVTLQLSADPWVYQGDSGSGRTSATGALSTYQTPGPRTLVLQIVEARDLAPRDWGGTCDPFVILRYDSRTLKTAAAATTSRPVWNRTFVLPENPSPLTRRLALDVVDAGGARGGGDEELGSTFINLDVATENTIQDRWLQLAGDESSGELRVRLAAVPGAADGQAVRQMVALFAGILDRTPSDTLQVVVMSGRNLPARSGVLGARRGGGRDTQVVVALGGSRQTTPVATNNQSPSWNFSALFPLGAARREAAEAVAASGGGAGGGGGEAAQQQQQQQQQQDSSGPILLHLELLDVLELGMGGGPAAQRGSGESLGSAALDVRQLVPEPGMVWEQWVPLSKGRAPVELLVRVVHLDASPLVPSSLPLPGSMLQQQQQQRQGQGGASGSSAGGGLGAVAGGRRRRGADGGGELREVVIGALSDQVEKANRRARAAAESYESQLRQRLRDDVMPKVQGWWGSLSREAARLAKETSDAVRAGAWVPGGGEKEKDKAKGGGEGAGQPGEGGSPSAAETGSGGGAGDAGKASGAAAAAAAAGGKEQLPGTRLFALDPHDRDANVPEPPAVATAAADAGTSVANSASHASTRAVGAWNAGWAGGREGRDAAAAAASRWDLGALLGQVWPGVAWPGRGGKQEDEKEGAGAGSPQLALPPPAGPGGALQLALPAGGGSTAPQGGAGGAPPGTASSAGDAGGQAGKAGGQAGDEDGAAGSGLAVRASGAGDDAPTARAGALADARAAAAGAGGEGAALPSSSPHLQLAELARAGVLAAEAAVATIAAVAVSGAGGAALGAHAAGSEPATRGGGGGDGGLRKTEGTGPSSNAAVDAATAVVSVGSGPGSWGDTAGSGSWDDGDLHDDDTHDNGGGAAPPVAGQQQQQQHSVWDTLWVFPGGSWDEGKGSPMDRGGGQQAQGQGQVDPNSKPDVADG